MNATGPIERTVKVLADAGYEVVEQPREIGGIPFEFAAMLAGQTSLDLIALVDLAIDNDPERLRRRVTGLARALDLVRSLRSLTLVLVGPRPDPGLVQAIARVARVLTVGTPAADDDPALRDALAVLLPLEVQTDDSRVDETWVEVMQQIGADHPSEGARVLAASNSGAEAVSAALRDILSEPIETLYESEADGEELV
jgi:hypothetical protein